MLRQLLVLCFFLHFFTGYAQSEIVPSITVGSGIDFTNEPITPQSEYSHSQTIYYPGQLSFAGTINSITYFTTFGNVNMQNSNNWIIRIGTTTIEEFEQGDSFIPISQLTQVFNGGTLILNQQQITANFTQPFYYDGQSNLVIDVEEVGPGSTPSNISGFIGTENFFNPPTRSMISLDGILVYENSYPDIKFAGSLERCLPVYQGTFTNVSPTSVIAQWPNPANIPAFIYNVSLVGDPIPANGDVVQGNTVTLDNLLPASYYNLNRKADCDVAPTNFGTQQFVTRPLPLTVPTEISFDAADTHNYLTRPVGFYGVSNVSSLAGANGSANGILFSGAATTIASQQWVNGVAGSNPFVNNPGFITSVTYNLDLTSYTGTPVFKFDLKQSNESYFRVKINGVVTDYLYTAAAAPTNQFHTIAIDLSDKIGSSFDIVMEHVSKSTPATIPTLRTAFVDNVKLVEATCESPYNIAATAFEDSIALSWQSEATQWEVAYTGHDLLPPLSGIIVNQSFYVIDELPVATSCDIYVRSVCENDKSAWVKIIKSTLPLVIQVPYEQTFNSQTLNSYIAPQYNNSSRIAFAGSPNYHLSFYQKQKGYQWVGGLQTTEYQAWNDNKEFVSGITFRVNATNLSSLQAVIKLKQQYFYSTKSSWYRIKINGQQFGASRNPTQMSNEPYVDLSYDLSQFVGGIVEITLEHCGRDTGNYLSGGVMDITRVDNVIFNGVVDPSICSLVPTTLPNINAQCAVNISDVVPPVITDSCGNTITGTTVASLFPITNQGTTPITWTFANSSSTITQNQNIVIDDTVPPVPALLQDIVATCSLSASDITPPVGNDECAGLITATTTTVFPITNPGNHLITWTYNDGHGNSVTQTQNVAINTPLPVPTVANLPTLTANCSLEFTDIVPPVATSECAGSIVTGTTTTIFPINTPGNHVITWIYNDGQNSVTQTQNVAINVPLPVPAVVNLSPLTASCSLEFNDVLLPIAFSECTGTITGTTSAVFPINTPGSHVITWTYTDGLSSITQNQNVIITAPLPVPVVQSLAPVSVSCNATITDLAVPTAISECYGTITGELIGTDLPITFPGIQITWYFDDLHGGVVTQNQQVIVTDVTAPVPAQASLPDINLSCVANINDVPVPTAIDICSGMIEGNTATIFPITNQGTTLVTWTYNDGHGNTATQTQNVNLTDTTGPILQLQSYDAAINENGVAILDVLLLDNGSYDECGTIVGWSVEPQSFSCNELGVNTVTVSATDTNGNISEAIINVTVSDANGYCEELGTDNILMRSISIYPNPVKDILTITTNDSQIKLNEISLYSPLGQQVYTRSHNGNENKTTLQLNGLSEGVYLLQIKTDTGLYHSKVIKK